MNIFEWTTPGLFLVFGLFRQHQKRYNFATNTKCVKLSIWCLCKESNSRHFQLILLPFPLQQGSRPLIQTLSQSFDFSVFLGQIRTPTLKSSDCRPHRGQRKRSETIVTTISSVFFNGSSPSYFCLLPFFSKKLLHKNLSWIQSCDHWRIRQACWPLEHHQFQVFVVLH